MSMNVKPKLKANHLHCIRVTWILISAVVLAGCRTGAPNPKPIALNIQATGEAAKLTIHVYIGAANQYARGLKEDPVDQILSDLKSSPPSTEDFVSFQLTESPKEISLKDPHWAVWRGPKNADWLIIIADLPRDMMRPGAEDPRRLAVPLDKNLWKHLTDHTVHVEISEKEVKMLENPGP
jgi:hypothetical protein